MPDAYEVYEGRQVQVFSNTSAADALNIGSVAVPSNTVRTILGASYTPSAAETRTVYWAIVTRGTSPAIIGITQPVAIALSAGIRFPLLTQGMEIKLFPGEYLIIYRDV